MMFNTMVIGAVEYMISADEENCVEARYLSTGSMSQDAGIICRGKAKGDTSNGFPGTYVIQYFGTNGDLVGEFDWAIEAVGEGFRLTWGNRATNALLPMAPGITVFEGFGFPTSDRTIVVAYWMTDEASAKMASAMAGRQTASA